MQTVSFILNGNTATKSELDGVLRKFKRIKKSYRERIEYILYFSKAPEFTSSSRSVILVYSENKKVTSVQKSVATASGEALIFTTIHNLLADTNDAMLGQALSISISTVAAPVPLRLSMIYKLAGIRYFYKTPYIIAEKHFTVRLYRHVKSPASLITNADKQLSLKRVPLPLGVNFPDHIIHKLKFSRPYIVIIKHKWQAMAKSVQEWNQARIAEKLRRQVKPVAYSENIPVFIICRDRVEPLKELVKWCEDEGLKNIIFVDNASTYPPLLEYLSSSPYEVIWLSSNVGHTAPWDEGVIEIYAKGKPFIVTDPDVIPAPEAHGAVKIFCRLLTDHPERTKVGFGLKIDDIPKEYALRDYVIAWEKQFWESLVEKDVYDAEIDTTFALYRQNTPYTLGPGLRTGGKYVAVHEPWYTNSKNISKELKYYRDHANTAIGSWGTSASDLSQTYLSHRHKAGSGSPSP